jgi:hypothetical protein
MRVGRTHHGGMALARRGEIVGEAARSRGKADILLAGERTADELELRVRLGHFGRVR